MQQGLFLRQHGQLLHQQRRRLPIVQPARSASVRAQPDAYPDLDAFVNKIAAMNRQTVADFKVTQNQTVADFKVTQNQTLADFKVSSNQVVDKAVYELKLEYQRLQFICAAVIAAVALGAGSDSLLGQFASLIITKLLK